MKVGGRYPMDDGHVVVDSIVAIEIGDITYDLARESGFASVDDLLQIARHGRGDNVLLDSISLPAARRVGHAENSKLT